MATKKFLDDAGLHYLLEQLSAFIDQKTQINIVGDIDENSTNLQIAGAKAVYDLVAQALAGLTTLSIKVVSALPATGEHRVVYFIQKDPAIKKYDQWIDIDGTGNWFDIGDTDIDLSGYWAKDELEALSNNEVQDIFDDVMGV